MGRLRLYLLALLNIFREFSKSTIESFLVGIIVSPFLCCFGSILRIIVFWLIEILLLIEGLIVRREGSCGVVESIERLSNFSLMLQFLLTF